MHGGVELHRGRTSNLMRVVVAADPRLHTAVAMWQVRAGSRDEPERLSGLSHLLEHLKFRGTERFPYEEGVLRHLRSFGGLHNAFTTVDGTSFFIICQPQHLPRALDLLGDLAATHRFNGLETERRVVLEELEEHQQHDGIVWDLNEVVSLGLWPKHPVGRPVLGNPKAVLSITAEDLEQHFATHYSADNSVLAIAGPVKPRTALALAEEHFARLRRAPVPPRAPVPAPAPGRLVRLESGYRTEARLAFGFRCTEDRDALAIRLLAQVLNDRLHDGLRGKKGLTYTSRAFVFGYADFGVLQVQVQVGGGKLSAAAAEWGAHLGQLRSDGPSETEVEQARETVRTTALATWNDPYELATALAASALDPSSVALEESGPLLDRLTAAEVKETAARLFDGKAAHLVVRGQPYPGEYEGAWAQVGKALGKS